MEDTTVAENVATTLKLKEKQLEYLDEMAKKIIAVLRHPQLQETLKQHGAMEVRRLTWDGAASRCEQVYDDVRREMAA